MSLARDIADLGAVTSRLDTLGASSGALSNRNLIINGAMQVAQRGTSFSGSTGVVQLVDRWHTPIGTSFNLDTTITQSTTVPTGEGFKYSLKVEADSVVTPSGGENGGIGTKFEGQDIEHFAYGSSSAKSVTLSFWVRSNKTGVYCCQLQVNQYGGSNQYGQVKEYTISAADTWEKKTLTFSGLTAQAVETVTGDGLRVLWWLACGSSDHVAADTWIQTASYGATSNQVNFMDSASNEWYLTGVQLEVGTATDFEHRSFGDELQRCKRYFEAYAPITNDDGSINVWRTRTSVNNYNGIVHFLEKRVQPTCTLDYDRLHKPGVAKDTLSNISVTIGSGQTTSCTVNCTPDNDSSISTSAFLGKNSGTAKLSLDAEL